MNNTTILVSIIIPCYNSGNYLLEAISSVEEYDGSYSYEIIVVNDGSNETETLNALQEVSLKEKVVVINQNNKGPASARNNGVVQSNGEFLLFLDSDNKIKPRYIDIGADILLNSSDVGVVYGKPLFFGESSNLNFSDKQFDLATILVNNYIDTCAIVRKKVWEEIGGFDENRILLQEDWDFWISVGATNWKFKFVDEYLFEYRVRANSRVTTSHAEIEYRRMLRYIYTKHIDLYIEQFIKNSFSINQLKRECSNPLRLLLKTIYRKIVIG